MKKHFVYVILIMLFVGCNNSIKDADSTQLIQFTEGAILFPKEKVLFEYIPLETRDDCLIGHMGRVELFEDRFYISDRKWAALLVFDKEGKFITEIGSKGPGPSQYTSFTHFCIDKKNRQILIDDMENLRLLYYSLDTYEFISSASVPFARSSFEVLPNSDLMWFAKTGTEDSKQKDYFSRTDSHFNPTHSYYKAFFKSPVSLSINDNFIYTVENNIFLYHSLAPYIYKVNGENMDIHYEFSFPGHVFPPVSFLKEISKDWNSYMDKLTRSEYIVSWGVNETKDILVITYQVKKDFYIVFYDKNRDEKYWYPMNKFTEHSGLDVLLAPIGNTDEYLLFQVPFISSASYEITDPILLKIKEQITEESNPVICLMKYVNP